MRSCLLFLVFILGARPASAQWYVTAFMGDAATAPSTLGVRSEDGGSSLFVGPIELHDESFESPWYYGARITRQLERTPWFGVEVEFIHAKVIADPSQFVTVRGQLGGTAVDGRQPLAFVLPRFELSHGLNFLLGNAVVSWPIGQRGSDPLIVVAGRLGAGPTIPHVESIFAGQDVDEYQLGRVAIAGAIGARISLSSRLSAVVELKLTRTHQRVTVGSAHLDGVFTTRHIVAGVAWRVTSPRHRVFMRR